jgi:nicotinamidase-related amidase
MTGLVVVDVQRDLVDELSPESRTAFLQTLTPLIERARAARTPVIFVRHDGSPVELFPGSPGWEVAGELKRRPGEPVIDKRFRDAFRETALAEVLAELAIDELVICGMHSEFCVDATVREAERRGYRVTLVEDGHVTLPAGGLSADQIRAHVNRVAAGKIARILPAAALYPATATRTSGEDSEHRRGDGEDQFVKPL